MRQLITDDNDKMIADGGLDIGRMPLGFLAGNKLHVSWVYLFI